jgi:SAF domain
MPEIVLGVLLVAGCALGALLWQRTANETTTVVVARRPIAQGATITADDLRGAQIGGEIAGLISGDRAHELLGRVALVDIGAGAPLTATMVAENEPLGPDEALTSMALDAGEFPSDLAPHDHVRLVVTSPADASGQVTTRMLDGDAIVWSVAAAPDGMSTVVTIRGALDLSAEVASAAKVQLALVEGAPA